MRYVTKEQRSRRPIFIATLWAARLLAGCFVAHQSKTTAGILPLASRIQPEFAAAPPYQSRTWCTRLLVPQDDILEGLDGLLGDSCRSPRPL
jgi:hypothetical protein